VILRGRARNATTLFRNWWMCTDRFLLFQRSHDQISRDRSRGQSPWLVNRPDLSTNHSFASSSTTSSLRLPTPRYSGDGLDLRRPVMSQPPQTVIDLTDEPDTPPQPRHRHQHSRTSSRATRPPRFSRGDIIDLEDRSEEPARRPAHTSAGSPELELLYSRSVPAEAQARRQNGVGVASYVGPLEPQPQLAGPGDFQSASQQGWYGNGPGGLARLQEFARRMDRRVRPAAAAGIRGEDMIRREVAGMAQPAPLMHRRPVIPALEDDLFVFDGHGEIELPQMMDYENAGFALATPPPTYKAPSPAQEGFTRSPTEEDVLVCPNCDQELGAGEDELKRQVWVVRSCGHVCHPVFKIARTTADSRAKVYCGECMKNRPKPKGKSARRPTKTKPFSHCQVAGCGKSVKLPKSMFQVYL